MEKGYPEQYLCHGLLCCLREAPQVVVQCRVHHSGVYGVDGHREPAGSQLLLQVVGEENQRQFALSVSAVGAVAFPADGGQQINALGNEHEVDRQSGFIHRRSANNTDRPHLQVVPPVQVVHEHDS